MFICGTTGYNKLKGQHYYVLKIPQHQKKKRKKKGCVTYSKTHHIIPFKE